MKACEWCGIAYGPRPKEGGILYARRLYCSKRCAGLAGNPRTPDDEFAARYRQVNTPDGSRMLEHRWVMEQFLGRKLRSDEQVHHKNHNRLDNRPENLEVVSSAEHGKRHTFLPTVKTCAVCGVQFTPYKTKRRRAKTCGNVCGHVLSVKTRSERAS